MERSIYEQRMATYKKGTYIKMVWQQITPNGVKLSDGVVRFSNPEVATSKKGEDYVTIRITKSPKHHTKVTYFNNDGEVITKEQYEALGNPTYEITDYFRKHLEDIIQLG